MAEVSFGEWLKRRRGAEGWTQGQLAQKINCSLSALRKMEAEERRPSAQVIQQLAEIFSIPQNERKSFLRFARGDWQAFSGPSQEAEDVPWLLSRVVAHSNLPASLTTFIGREKEQTEIIQLLSKYRLVTLTGPGGVGKTRLSIKVGEQVLSDYANGAWFVELASLNDPTLLPQSVTAVFGIAAQSNTSPTEILINFLRAKTALLILDNCEHLLEACAQLADSLLKSCPHLKILATSRESLAISGEAAYPVPSLGLPDREKLPENFRGYESVCLFEERAQLAKMDFSLTLENASAVAQICHRLDGIPLAIELAAAHVKMFSAQQIATRLNESFNLLTGGSRTALPRQQTIHASIEWSWNLLSDSERILLQRLSVFAGGWTLESAESVCSENGIEEKQVMGLLTQLVAKSLVVMNQEARSETRYHLLETIRRYADEKLIEAGEKETIRTWHLKYFLQFSVQLDLELEGPQQAMWQVLAFDEVDNMRASLHWAEKTDTEAGLYLSSRLAWLWFNYDIQEGIDWLSRFLQKPESYTYPRARMQALYTYGDILRLQSQFDAVRSAAEEGIELAHTLGDPRGEVDGLLLLSWGSSNNPTQREKLCQHALGMAQALGDGRRQLLALRELGWHEQGKGSRKFEYWTKAIALARSLEHWRLLANLLSALGHFLVLNGEVEAAQRHLDEADMLYKKINLTSVRSELLIGYGQIALMRSDFNKARGYFQEVVGIAVEFSIREYYFWARTLLGYVALREGNLAEARLLFHQTVGSFQQDKNEIGVVFTLEGMAGLYIAIGKPEHAALLIGWADAMREKVGDIRVRVEQANVDKTITACLEKIGETAFADAYDEGQKMSMEEAVAYAIQEG